MLLYLSRFWSVEECTIKIIFLASSVLLRFVRKLLASMEPVTTLCPLGLELRLFPKVVF
jgi:hypothetical protein